MSIYENIRSPLAAAFPGDQTHVRKADEMVEIGDTLTQAAALSGGQRHVRPARAIVRRRSLQDGAPLSNLDASPPHHAGQLNTSARS